jgi:c-di-GMP-binding flagellar brake protein YcgR
METRKTPRFPLSLKTKLKVDPSVKQHFDIARKDVEADILDISLGGIGLMCQYFIPRGVILNLEFKITDAVIQLKGEVRWAKPAGRGQTRVGIQFMDMSKEQKRALEGFLKEHKKRNHPRLDS